jgi:hypothetical protein
MSEPAKSLEELNDEKVTKLIAGKIAAADDADSGWFVGYAVMRMLPVMKELLQTMKQIDLAIAPDHAGSNIADALNGISTAIRGGQE